MAEREVWEINDGFEAFPPNTKEFLFIEVEVPDFILTYTLGHAKSKREFMAAGITLRDLDNDYKEGEHVFILNFTMQDTYPSKPTKTVKLTAPAYIDMEQGTSYHIVVLADKKKKSRRKSGMVLVIDQH